MALNTPVMVTSSTGKGVICMDANSKAMFELTESMEWNPMEQTLKRDHVKPIAFAIPDVLVKEK